MNTEIVLFFLKSIGFLKFVVFWLKTNIKKPQKRFNCQFRDELYVDRGKLRLNSFAYQNVTRGPLWVNALNQIASDWTDWIVKRFNFRHRVANFVTFSVSLFGATHNFKLKCKSCHKCAALNIATKLNTRKTAELNSSSKS